MSVVNTHVNLPEMVSTGESLKTRPYTRKTKVFTQHFLELNGKALYTEQ